MQLNTEHGKDDDVLRACSELRVGATATAPQRARAEALALYDQSARGASSSSSSSSSSSDSAGPQQGDTLYLVNCSGKSAAATSWTQRHGAARWEPGVPFQISLTANQSLCVEAHAPMHAGGSGAHLTLQKCDERHLPPPAEAEARGKLQMFTRNTTAAHGDDITGPVNGPQRCPCWNVNVNNPGHPSMPNGAVPYVQCESCVDGSVSEP